MGMVTKGDGIQQKGMVFPTKGGYMPNKKGLNTQQKGVKYPTKGDGIPLIKPYKIKAHRPPKSI